VEIDNEGHVETQRLLYTPLRHLTTLPPRGSATPLEILQTIEKLATRTKDDEGEDWPYLELRVQEKQPEPTLLHQVTSALEDKAVHFCRIVRVYQNDGTSSATSKKVETLHTLTPTEIADLVFQDKFNTPMPDALKQRLLIAQEEALAEQKQ
jgi:exonuclease SbcD